MTAGTAKHLRLSTESRHVLERVAAAPSLPYRRVVMARACLLLADGVTTSEVARRCGTTPNTIRRWRSRFLTAGVEGLGEIAPGRGRKPTVRRAVAEAIARDTQQPPPPGRGRWTLRDMASRHGVSKETVARVWRERGLQPGRVVEEDRDTVPASSAPRTRGAGAPEAGVISVLAALDEATGGALSRCRPHEVHRDFLLFVKLTEAIELWVEHWDDPTRAFAWRSRDEIVTKVNRARIALDHYIKSATS